MTLTPFQDGKNCRAVTLVTSEWHQLGFGLQSSMTPKQVQKLSLRAYSTSDGWNVGRLPIISKDKVESSISVIREDQGNSQLQRGLNDQHLQ